MGVEKAPAQPYAAVRQNERQRGIQPLPVHVGRYNGALYSLRYMGRCPVLPCCIRICGRKGFMHGLL
ncbi:hypothetical protein DSM101010T_05650 [Desulfovibrio subterraneus]|uniref:Uncharacterized protein n=1 Tax=Desulfovibrio subterraneus TaxID=2718620 RepID=A0A7J0BER2_9BACT|nr:hypothetical protein DSM101010T_05650 [Desulfovibrio subterraneus]